MNTAIAVAEWLRSLENVSFAVPVAVRSGHRTYPAAQYTENRDGFDEERLYVIGEMPPLHEKRRLCYRTDDSGYDWHVRAWLRQRVPCKEWSEVSPFGSHFVLVQYSPIQSWAADQCYKKPYRRIPITITEVGPVAQSTEEKQDGAE